LPYLDLFIADKLSLPVAYFNPLRNVNLDASLNTTYLQQNSCFTAELVGLALRETGSCPAEVILDAPTLTIRADKRRKQPYYFGALAAWTLLVVCMGLSYSQQIAVAHTMTKTLTDNAQDLQTLAPKIGILAKEQDLLQQTLDSVVKLGNQRDAWARVLAALNDKIPPGVWITELVPVSNPKGSEGAPHSAGAGAEAPVNEVNMLVISGLYHANARTQMVNTDNLRDFVKALADAKSPDGLLYFNIDKNNITETMPEYGGDPNAFAQKFSMRLKLKVPISLKPDASKP
jgi:type IV pilus assembly protein PilM